jgi:Helix-turn-helix.
MEENSLFYKRLMKASEQRGKSINSIERELGYARNALHNYKNGGEPSGSRLIEIAQYFQLSPEYLMGKELNDARFCASNTFERLNDEQKLEILKIAEQWGYNRIIDPSIK